MIDQIITLPGLEFDQTDSSEAISQFRQEYLKIQKLFQAQPSQNQRKLEAEALVIADAILQDSSQVRFTLPGQVFLNTGDKPAAIPQYLRSQVVGKFYFHLQHKDLRTALRQSLLESEQSNHPAVSTAAALLRYTIAITLVHRMLPAGRAVTYTTAEADSIPSVPISNSSGSKSALQATTDAIIESGQADEERSELQVPYVEAARRFYLPQWVAFDDQFRLLVGSLGEAEAHIASLQRYLFILHVAIGLGPYMVADENYQHKRYGVLGQLVNQGRALARYQVQEIIRNIQLRSAAQELNRGLSLRLPYFDDQKLTIDDYEFDVIPAGRIMFIPAFVVRAAHEQQVKVAQDTRLSPSTRRHLLTLFYLLGSAFYSPKGEIPQNNKG